METPGGRIYRQTRTASERSSRESHSVITSYSIHYTKLYDKIPISGGNYQITLTEEVNGNTNQSSVEVPTELVLILPFFKYRDSEEQMVELRALIDWKLSDNKLLFGLTFPRLEKIFCDEFSKIRAEIAKKTGLYVFV